VYNVTLRVTDTDRQSSETYAVIAVENAEPIPDFDFWPAVVTTDTIVTFNDGSEDPDGAVVSWAWDFGDGTTSDDRNPSHSFSASGPATVRLTVVDDRGASASVSKVVDVRNTPPMARFNYSPNDVQTLVPVLFQDDSADKDGTIVSRAWNFGDGTTASGPSVEHSFARPGVFTVSLTVTDNAGDSDTTTATILVRNRLPLVSFSWSPVGATSDVPVQFTSLSTDPDGTILVYQWGFGDGTTVSNGGPAVTHQFPRAGTYNVTLTVTDSMLQTNSSTVEVGIANAIPRPQIGVSPNPVFRGVEVALVDLSTDPDGDAIVERTWDLGPGVDPAHDAVVRHVFTETGLYPVKLTVRDAAGNSASTSTTVRVTNRPPVVSSVSSWPPFPNVDQPTYFNASGADVDAQPGDPEVRYEWRFSDGVTLAGAEVVRTFANPGRVGATVRLYDYENASSNPATTGVDVQLALPAVAFAWAPATPASGEPVSFRSLSTSLNGPITSASWDFDDGTAAQGESVDHVFEDGRTYLVRLTVTDNRSRSASLQLPVRVNDRPVADFAVSRQGVVPLGVPVAFSDLSRDPDGSVTHWQWDFGDGASNEPSPTHAFTTPGEHHVELTVTDNEGAADTTVRVVRVENRPPVARWAATGGALVGDVFAFQSRAFDPDGLPLASWYWSFGDGTTSRAENPTHVYAQSGHYTVSLQVTDGELASRAEPGSYGVVRVGADHAVDVLVRAVLPDGSPADLNSGDYAVSAVVGQGAFGFQTIQGSRLLASGATDRTFRLDANEWVRGDFVVVSLAAPGYFPEVVRKTWALAEHDGVTRAVEVVLEVPMPLVATLAPASGARDALPDLPLIAPNAETTPDGDAVYRDLTEAFRGAGVVRFADGTPVFGATVQIETRYLGARALAAPRESLTQDGNLLGWCLADTRTTGADGAYAWTFEAARSACAPHDLGVNPIGRWEVRAKVMFSFAPTAQTATRAIYVDPTGGLLWSASAPP
ncbi:MAG TPA: PKD domain-containing protein, partial [Candidatus Thermoplasmatota archaeon]|nr:PKD domain-containing protein [Candidatus Thermoplasmatota archaeon]